MKKQVSAEQVSGIKAYADALAKASSENYSDPTDAIFGTDELEA